MSNVPPYPAPYPNHTTSGYDPNLQYMNPTGTMPGPAFAWWLRPLSNYVQTRRRVQMLAPTATITPENDIEVPASGTPTLRGVWASPVFDLTPMLASSTVAQGGVVLARGPHARLLVQLELTNTQNKLLNVYVAERASAYAPEDVRAVGPAQAVSYIMGDRLSARQRPTLTIDAPEAGVRYWQVYVIIDNMDTAPATAFDFNVTATAF